MNQIEACYTLVGLDDSVEVPSLNELRQALEKGTENSRVETMKKILVHMMNGEPMHQLLMHVIRFVMPSQKNKFLKKLMLMFFEACPKTNPDGKLKQEWILVCNALRNDLQHPNEYVRGTTLRFVCKLREAELLEPLLPSIRSCLEYRHSYVRRNAVFAVYSVYKNHDVLIPDAPELLFDFLSKEGDMSCKRNAFHMLYNIDQKRAIKYLLSVIDQVPSFDEHLQLAIVELIHKECLTDSVEKAKYIKCVFSLVSATSNAVRFESANTLVSLTSAPTAVKAAASCYIDLAVKESDNNVKLIVLDRFKSLKNSYGKLLDDFAIDILRVLASPDLEVRKKSISIMLEMVSSKNVSDIVGFLKKEIVKARDQDVEKGHEYKQLLIQSIHACAIRFSQLVSGVASVLLEFVNDKNVSVGVDVVHFVREVFEKYPEIRKELMPQILHGLQVSKHSKVARGLLWIVGEFTETDIQGSFAAIRKSIGEIPILESETSDEEKDTYALESPSSNAPKPSSQNRRILPDGTYASESAFSGSLNDAKQLNIIGSKAKPTLRGLLLDGEFFLGACLASCLLKLVLKAGKLLGENTGMAHKLRAEAMLIITSIIRLGRSEIPANKMDNDSFERMLFNLKVLASATTDSNFSKILLQDQRDAFSAVLKKEDEKKAEAQKAAAGSEGQSQCQIDDLLQFRQLQAKTTMTGSPAESFDLDLIRATGSEEEKGKKLSKLDSIVQLTGTYEFLPEYFDKKWAMFVGFSDPIYAEAYVDIRKYDIVIDVLLVNQTAETFQNVLVELSTVGDLKLVEKPAQFTLGPQSFHSMKATIKVSSSDNGVIFGNILFDRTGALDSHCIVLNNITIDIIEYMKPSSCSDVKYRSMWVEFEWENKVNVKTTITDINQYVKMILEGTRMGCLTKNQDVSGECNFLAANLYCRSIFGEDVVANMCLEKSGDQISGHIRIRTKTQGIAFAIGEKIMSLQRGPSPLQ